MYKSSITYFNLMLDSYQPRHVIFFFKDIFVYILTLNLSDLNRTLETLQQRVQALEKNLAPFTTGYPAMQSYGYQMNSTPMTNGKFRESLTVIFK